MATSSRQQMAGDSAQPGLRVAQFLAHQQPEYRARNRVSGTAAARDRAVESARAQHQRLRILRQTPRHAHDVFRMMLAVGIGGHHAASGMRGENVLDSGPQRRAFAQILFVPRMVAGQALKIGA